MAEGGSSGYKESINYDEATVDQYEKIQKEIIETSEYIADKEEVSCLLKEYSSEDTIYQTKIKDLNKRYSHLRKTRGDGNCFYRAIAFAYMEKMLHNSSDISRMKKAVTELKEKIATENTGYDYDEFHEVFVDLLDSAAKPDATIKQLLEIRQRKTKYKLSPLHMATLTVERELPKILTSGYLQLHREFYQSFIEGGLTVQQYCNREVDPMYRESDHIHISALTAALGINVRVEYVDRGEGDKVNSHDFPEGAPPTIHLLYRPGHYDILYPLPVST